MIRYQLPDGSSIELSIEEYLDLSDAELQDLVLNPYTEEISDPFYGSVIRMHQEIEDEEDDIDTSIDTCLED